MRTTNKRLALMGKKPIKKLDDLPDDFEFDDVVLNETVAIASDFADAQKQKLYKASKAPVLTRFQVERDEISKGSGTSSPPGVAAMPARPDADRVQNSSLKSKAHAKAKESTKEGAKDSTKDSTEKTAALEGSVATAAAAEMKEPQSYGVSMQADSAEFSAQSYATGTGEINNMDADGALLGPWRTVNEDDTYLRVSDTEFKALIEDSNTNSTVNYLRDNSYPSVMQEDSAVAEDKSVIRMVR